MSELVWKVIEESKSGVPYLPSEEQFEQLGKILSRYDNETIEEIRKEWSVKTRELLNDEFNLLHIDNGGIICSGDDGFYMDFGNWVIAQGEGLFNRFKEEGHQAILDYIKEHDVPEDDYMFECIVYVFQDLLRK